jgi:V-type H+-transporting ATPase subunit a
MFGDIGHGLCLLIFGIALSLNKIFSPRSEQKKLRYQRIELGIQKNKQVNSKDQNDEDLNDMNIT